MATSIRRSRLLIPPKGRAYRLEMEGRTLVLLLSLMALTGVVVFALGVVTGMGLRVPPATISVADQPPPPASQQVPPAPETLAFNNGLQRAESTIEGLAAQGDEASRDTRSLLKRAEQELKMEELPPARPGRAASAPSSTRPGIAVTTPSNAPGVTVGSAAGDETLYTVQVFSSRSRDNARDLMDKLKELGFAAYMNQYQGSDQETWFRVRVGKSNRSDAELLVVRLKRDARMKAPRIIQL